MPVRVKKLWRNLLCKFGLSVSDLHIPLAVHCLNTSPSPPNSAFGVVQNRIRRSLTLDTPYDTPSLINSFLRVFDSNFMFATMIDAHVYFRALVNKCQKEYPIVGDMFQIRLETNFFCLRCNSCLELPWREKVPEEEFSMSLDLKGTKSLQGTMDNLMLAEMDNSLVGIMCQTCKAPVSGGARRTCLGQALDVLVLHLKRFEEGSKKKINDYNISFEEFLDISSYVGQVQNSKYNLVSLIVHEGDRADSGHYIAYVKGLTDADRKDFREGITDSVKGRLLGRIRSVMD